MIFFFFLLRESGARGSRLASETVAQAALAALPALALVSAVDASAAAARWFGAV